MACILLGWVKDYMFLENTDLEYGYSQICYMYSHSFSSLRQKGLI